MMTLKEITRTNIEKARRLEHRKRQKEYAQAKREKARHDALTFRVGEIVLACWPQVAKLKVRKTKEENTAEFAPLRELLMQIISDPHYITAIYLLASNTREDVRK